MHTDHDGNRARILAALAATPGLCTREVARAIGADESTADYHLRRLARGGHVTRARAGRGVAWFRAGCGFCPVLRRAIPEFRRAEVARVARALDERPRPATDVAARSGVRVGAVRWILPILDEVGVVQRSRSGRTSLRDGARLCVAKAAAAQGCWEWGRCPVSRALDAGEAAAIPALRPRLT